VVYQPLPAHQKTRIKVFTAESVRTKPVNKLIKTGDLYHYKCSSGNIFLFWLKESFLTILIDEIMLLSSYPGCYFSIIEPYFF